MSRIAWRDEIAAGVDGARREDSLVAFSAAKLVSALVECGRVSTRAEAVTLCVALVARDVLRPSSPSTPYAFADNGQTWVCRAGEEGDGRCAAAFSPAALAMSAGAYVLGPCAFLKRGDYGFLNPRTLVLDSRAARLYVYTSPTSGLPRHALDLGGAMVELLTAGGTVYLRPEVPGGDADTDTEGEEEEEEQARARTELQHGLRISLPGRPASAAFVMYTPSRDRARVWATAASAAAAGLPHPLGAVSHYQAALVRTAPPVAALIRRTLRSPPGPSSASFFGPLSGSLSPSLLSHLAAIIGLAPGRERAKSGAEGPHAVSVGSLLVAAEAAAEGAAQLDSVQFEGGEEEGEEGEEEAGDRGDDVSVASWDVDVAEFGGLEEDSSASQPARCAPWVGAHDPPTQDFEADPTRAGLGWGLTTAGRASLAPSLSWPLGLYAAVQAGEFELPTGVAEGAAAPALPLRQLLTSSAARMRWHLGIYVGPVARALAAGLQGTLPVASGSGAPALVADGWREALPSLSRHVAGARARLEGAQGEARRQRRRSGRRKSEEGEGVGIDGGAHTVHLSGLPEGRGGKRHAPGPCAAFDGMALPASVSEGVAAAVEHAFESQQAAEVDADGWAEAVRDGRSWGAEAEGGERGAEVRQRRAHAAGCAALREALTRRAVAVLASGGPPSAVFLQTVAVGVHAVFGRATAVALGLPGREGRSSDGRPAATTEAAAALNGLAAESVDAVVAPIAAWVGSWLGALGDWAAVSACLRPSTDRHTPDSWRRSCALLSSVVAEVRGDVGGGTELARAAAQRVLLGRAYGGVASCLAALYRASYAADDAALGDAYARLTDGGRGLGGTLGLAGALSLLDEGAPLAAARCTAEGGEPTLSAPLEPAACTAAAGGLLPPRRRAGGGGGEGAWVRSPPTLFTAATLSACFLRPAATLLASLSTLAAPADRCRAICSLADALCASVGARESAVAGAAAQGAGGEEPRTRSRPPPPSTLSADDMLGLLALLVLAARLPGLPATLAATADGAGDGALMEKSGFLLTTLQGALMFIVDCT